MPNLDANAQNGAQGSSPLYDYGTSPNTRVAISQKVRLLAPLYGAGAGALNHMGVVSSFSPSMSRSADPVRGIGFGDKIAELVPSVTEPVSGSIERALLYLCNLWQATGYAGGVAGPVRSLAHHKWPFDIEQQLVFSTVADRDLGRANTGAPAGAERGFGGGVQTVRFPGVPNPVTGPTSPPAAYPGGALGHSAIITMFETCWWESWSASYSQDQATIMESGDVKVTDVHDFASIYGEFTPTGNDPTIGQGGSIRYAR